MNTICPNWVDTTESAPTAPAWLCSVVYWPNVGVAPVTLDRESLILWTESSLKTSRPGRPEMSIPWPAPRAVTGRPSFSRTSTKSTVMFHTLWSPGAQAYTREGAEGSPDIHTLFCHTAMQLPRGEVDTGVHVVPSKPAALSVG